MTAGDRKRGICPNGTACACTGQCFEPSVTVSQIIQFTNWYAQDNNGVTLLDMANAMQKIDRKPE